MLRQPTSLLENNKICSLSQKEIIEKQLEKTVKNLKLIKFGYYVSDMIIRRKV